MARDPTFSPGATSYQREELGGPAYRSVRRIERDFRDAVDLPLDRNLRLDALGSGPQTRIDVSPLGRRRVERYGRRTIEFV